MSDLRIIIAKLEAIDKRIDNVDITLAKQEVSLAEHIRRTNLLEEKLEPVEKHVHMLNGAGKLFMFISAAVGVIAAIIKLITG